jgi:nicotinamide mononucleotide adenylyltransferase
MNQLTKFLLEDLLGDGEKKVTAIYGGGFKPPTKGHFEVVVKAAEQNPEIDDFIIYVGSGTRNGVTQDESIQIWNLYKKYLSKKIQIKPAIKPVGDILRYAKDHPEEKVLWIIGARENNQEDFADISSRTRTLDKYPNIELRVIQTSGGVSGTATRNAVKDNDKEQFFKMIPDIAEKQQVWDIVSPVVKEIVTATDVICDKCGWKWPIADGGDDLYICHKCGYDNNPDLEEGTCGYDTDVKTGKKLDTPGGLEEGKQVGPLYHYTSADGLKGILQSNKINTSEENYLGNELYYISFTRNKNFHKKGSNFGVKIKYRITLDGDKLSNKYKIQPFSYIPGWNYEDNWEYDWLEDEPENVRRDFFNATGDYDEQEERISFKNKNSSIVNIKDYILAVDKVEDLEEGRKKKSDPKKGTGKKPEGSSRRLYTDEDPKDTVSIKFKTKEDIVDTLNKKQFKAKSHARQSQVINLIHQRVRAAYGKSKDPEVKARLKRALDYIEKRKEMSKKKTERLNKENVAPNHNGRSGKYGSGFVPVKENDPFGLNELARQFIDETLKEMWKPEEAFVSLSKYMIDNGMNIKPLPKIKVISNDKDNASNLLGKTAYYDPTEKSITLYTMDRHPKDILRSFSHEMVHHEQNLEGRLNNINTTNTNKDGALPEIEREAYEKGNMMLRKWEDSIKNV